MEKAKILAFAGSTRTDSYNKKLVKVAAEGAVNAGAQLTYLDLRDLPMPLYDGDLEKTVGLPANAKSFKKILLAHRGLLIASPEYNSSIPGVLKNAIDWASRSETAQEGSLICFERKVVGLMSASPGQLGGLRGLVHLRAMLENIGCMVIPQQVAVGKAEEAFDADGYLRDHKKKKEVHQIGAELTRLLQHGC